jgi:hypothetical protein
MGNTYRKDCDGNSNKRGHNNNLMMVLSNLDFKNEYDDSINISLTQNEKTPKTQYYFLCIIKKGKTYQFRLTTYEINILLSHISMYDEHEYEKDEDKIVPTGDITIFNEYDYYTTIDIHTKETFKISKSSPPSPQQKFKQYNFSISYHGKMLHIKPILVEVELTVLELDNIKKILKNHFI